MTTPGGGGAADLVNAGPGNWGAGGAAPAQPRYIGVPAGYVAPGRPAASPVQADREASFAQFPRYTEDHIFAPRAMGVERIAMLQEQLKAAGLYSARAKFRVGTWDEFSQDAYARLLGYANQGGMDEERALQDLLSRPTVEGASDGAGGSGGEFFTGVKRQRDKTVDLTDPQSARTRIRRVLREELGRAPSQDEYASFVAALGGAERSNPTVVDSATSYAEGEQTGTNATRSGGVDPEAFTEEYVIEDPGLSAERNSFTRDTDYYQAAMSVLGMGGASG